MAINNLGTGLRPGVCTSTTRPTTPYEGQVIYETDTDLSYIYNGTAFYQVSGGTAVGNSGLVYITTGALSGATTNFQGCFTTAFRNYRIVIDNLSVGSSTWVYMRLLVGTSADATNNYNSGGHGFSNNGSTATRNASAFPYSFLSFMDTAALGVSANFDVCTPQTTARTFMQGTSMNFQSAFQYSSANFFVQHNATTQFDGIQFSTLGGPNITGNVAIYGYRVA